LRYTYLLLLSLSLSLPKKYDTRHRKEKRYGYIGGDVEKDTHIHTHKTTPNGKRRVVAYIYISMFFV
jgi:hypothetical protein